MGDVLLSNLDISVPVLDCIASTDLKEESVETLLPSLEEEEVCSLLFFDSGLPDKCVITLKKRTLEKLVELKGDSLAKCLLKCGAKLGDGQSDSEKKWKSYAGTAMQKKFHAYTIRDYSTALVQ